MKVLFVCRANVGRSQMGAGLYKAITGIEADSAGTIVPQEEEEQTLVERFGAINVIKAMDEVGVDMRQNRRHQINPADILSYDKVIVMAEPETVPAWLSQAPNYEYWSVPDSKDMDIETTRDIRDQIKKLIMTHLVE